MFILMYASHTNPRFEGEVEANDITIKANHFNQRCAVCEKTVLPAIRVVAAGRYYDRCMGCLGKYLIAGGFFW